MADKQKIDLLERQIECLEKRIFGDADKDSVYPKDSAQIVDTLASIKHQFHATVSGSKKAGPIMKRLGDLNDMLDPIVAEQLTNTREAKIDLILAEEAFLRRTVADLEKVKDLTDVLGSENMKVAPNLQSKLQELSKVHITQQDAICDLSDEAKEMLNQYNIAISLLSKQFVQWDALITKLEISSQPQKSLD